MLSSSSSRLKRQCIYSMGQLRDYIHPFSRGSRQPHATHLKLKLPPFPQNQLCLPGPLVVPDRTVSRLTFAWEVSSRFVNRKSIELSPCALWLCVLMSSCVEWHWHHPPLICIGISYETLLLQKLPKICKMHWRRREVLAVAMALSPLPLG